MINVWGITDKGVVRTQNQDGYYLDVPSEHLAVGVVCDGMGGANAGNIASEIASRRISEYIIKSYRKRMDSDDLEKIIRNAISSANIELYDMSVGDAALSGMGTTVVVALVKNDKAVIAHVGDSRVYIINETIKQLTRDHSVVQSLIESGKITPEDAKVHPRKNIITRALGAEEKVAVDSSVIDISDGDTLLLCTDGLNNYLDDTDILSVFTENDIADVPDRLVEMANNNGGGDNITVVTLTK